MKCKQKPSRSYLKHRKLKNVTQNQPPILIHRGAKSPNFYDIDPRSFKQTPL